jgi:DNA-binding PadR family transcriptional regulator
MIEELGKHGYSISPGTLYPILHNLEKEGYIKSTQKKINGKIRKYYKITSTGKQILDDGKNKAKELLKELME